MSWSEGRPASWGGWPSRTKAEALLVLLSGLFPGGFGGGTGELRRRSAEVLSGLLEWVPDSVVSVCSG